MKTDLTYAQASKQVHAYMAQTLRGLPSGIALQPLFNGDVDVVCSDDDGAPSTTPVSIQPAARLAGVAVDDYDQVIESFVGYWKRQGWHIALDKRPDSQYVVVENDADYELFLQVANNKQMISLGASTPCVPPKTSNVK